MSFRSSNRGITTAAITTANLLKVNTCIPALNSDIDTDIGTDTDTDTDIGIDTDTDIGIDKHHHAKILFSMR